MAASQNLPPGQLSGDGPTISVHQVETALLQALPADLHAQVPALVHALAEALRGVLTPDGTTLPADAALMPLLRQLAERQIAAEGTVLTFGEGNELGDVKIGDVAGRDLFNLTIQVVAAPDWRRGIGHPDEGTLQQSQEHLARLPLDAIPLPAPLPPGSRMPLSSNRLFVGRADDLRTLATALKGNATVAIGQVDITAATGLGGIGKTQLATEFVHRYGQYFLGGVFWLSFADASAIPGEVALCGDRDGLDLYPEAGSLPVEDQVRLVRAAWHSPLPRLLVFDNCEDEALLEQWRPAYGGCRVLLTSRRAQWDPTLVTHTVPLGVLQREESVALLRKHRPDLCPPMTPTFRRLRPNWATCRWPCISPTAS